MCPGVSLGILGCPGVSWGNKTDPFGGSEIGESEQNRQILDCSSMG